MKKLILFALVSLLIIPALAKAQQVSIFKNVRVEKNITDFIAGSTDYAKIYFYYAGAIFPELQGLNAPLIVRFNITETTGNYPVEKGDFDVSAYVISAGVNHTLKCVENINEINETPVIPYSSEFPDSIPDGTFYCYNPLAFNYIPPASDNYLYVYVTPNVALIPSTYNFTVELMSLYGIPLIEPVVSTNNDGYANFPEAYLEIILEKPEQVNFSVTLYGTLFVDKTPLNNPYGIRFIEIKNITPMSSNFATIRIHYTNAEVRGLDENRLSIYYWDESISDWNKLNSVINPDNNYVEANVTHFGLFGVFTSLLPSVQQQIIYGGGATNYYYNVTNVTQNITQPVEKTVVERYVEKAVCGNGICEVGESCSNCPQDCKCPNGYQCQEGICLPTPVCGNGYCEKGETPENCPEDCKPTTTTTLPTGITGRIVSIATNPIFAWSIATIIIAVALIFVFKRKIFEK
jgi:hypothetical protein